MANAIAHKEKRTLNRRTLVLGVLLLLLAEIILFAIFYAKIINPFNFLQSKLGVEAPTPLFGIYGSDTVGSLRRPMGVTVSDRSVYVTDTDNKRVVVFSYSGDPLYTFGSGGNNKGQFGFPYGITADNRGLIYVSDVYNGKISVFSQKGDFIQYFADTPKGQFQKPGGLFFFDNSIFVTDIGLGKVMQFDQSGKKLLEFGKTGTGDGEFDSPNFVTVSKDFIYVSDTSNNRVQKFDRSGKFVAANIGDPQNGQTNSAFVNTRGVAYGTNDILYVVSNMTNQLYGFDKDDRRAFQPVGTQGAEDNQFYLPNGLYIDDQGRIYVTDTLNGRVMVYHE